MRYTNITIDEMRQHLRKEKGWYETDPTPSTKEFIFQYDIPFWQGAVVKVFSSISMRTNGARQCGTDVIRVCAVDLNKNVGLHKSIRVLRVEGWRDNLRRSVIAVLHDLFRRRPRVSPQVDYDADCQDGEHFDEELELEHHLDRKAHETDWD